ncbi:MFS transporter [Actinomadura gamaensis]|uniref:MFS transporter n=1 Tax=Actinomadura gamaensis TaxID=1763541 RepID=A0ABV9U3T0_9ACTN
MTTSSPRPPSMGGLARHPVIRVLSAAMLVNTLGNGLFMTTSALLFTRAVGMSPSQVGVALALGGVFGIVAGVPMGRLADRFGARPTVVALLGLEGVLILGYTQVHSFWAAVPLICAVTFLDRGASAVRNALVAHALPAELRMPGRAFLRMMTNAGVGVGAALASLALVVDTPSAYRTVVVLDAVTFVLAALLLLKVPGARPSREAAASRGGFGALTDVPYLVITVLAGVLVLQQGILEVGVPLWVTRETHAPRLLVSVCLVLNTAMVIALQVRLTRGVEDTARAARACLRAGTLMAVGCVLFGLAKGPDPWTASILVLGALALQTIGEVLCAAGTWALSYELADERAHGVYQGVFNSGFAAGVLLGPLVVTQTALRYGMTGWLIFGAVFLAAGAVLVPVTRWAAANRPAWEDAPQKQQAVA